MLEKLTKNLIPISIVVVGLLIAGAFAYINWGKIEKVISGSSSSQQIAENTGPTELSADRPVNDALRVVEQVRNS